MLDHHLQERACAIAAGDEAVCVAMLRGDIYRQEISLASMSLCSQRVEPLRRNARQELDTLQ